MAMPRDLQLTGRNPAPHRRDRHLHPEQRLRRRSPARRRWRRGRRPRALGRWRRRPTSPVGRPPHRGLAPHRHGRATAAGSASATAAGIDFDVQLPAAARLDVSVVSADIDSDNLVGDQTYRTVSGDVVDRAAPAVASPPTTVSGDVRLTAVKPLEVNVTTTSGDAEVTAPLFQPVRMKTVSGDMSVRGGFAPGPQHSVESVSGDLNIESTTRPDGRQQARARLQQQEAATRPWLPATAARACASGRCRATCTCAGSRGSAPTPPAAPPAPARTRRCPRRTHMEILRALERGEIDVEEASRRLGGGRVNA